MKPEHPPADAIVIRGARQNNLKNLTLTLPANELIVVTGVSGSGKSSLVFDTLYAEGQRRYVETFSPYARQFLERMDKPQVDSVEGIPPAIAIDQTNPVRTSRSTVGTMTELNDHLKLLYARAAQLHCRGCGKPVRRDSPQSIYEALPRQHVTVTFPVPVPKNFSEKEVEALLQRQGYTKLHSRSRTLIEVVQDTVTPGTTKRHDAPWPLSRSFASSSAERAIVRACAAWAFAKPGSPPPNVARTRPASSAAASVTRGAAAIHCAACASRWSIALSLAGIAAAPMQASSS